MTTYRYIGQFQDVNYGVDETGELFESIEDAKRQLHNRHALGYWTDQGLVRPDGEMEAHRMPAVTGEALIFLWAISPITDEELAAHRITELPVVNALPDGQCEVYVYISRRHNTRSKRVQPS